jgi:hypothetical protein
MTKDAGLSLRISKEIKDALEKAAKDDHRSVASLVEKLLAEGLDKAGYLKKAGKK